MFKKAIQTIKVISAKYKHSDVLVVLEGGRDAERLSLLISKVFDGYYPYEVIDLNKLPKAEAKPLGFICSECKRTFKTLRGLKIHFNKKHEDIEFPEVPTIATETVSFKDELKNIKKHLKDNPKEVLILQRTDDSTFIEGQKDIRPLKYLVEEE